MTEHPGLLADILENPGDDTPRLVYADWLEDHGQDAAGRFIRRQIQNDGAPLVPLSWIGDTVRAMIPSRTLAGMHGRAIIRPAVYEDGSPQVEYRRGFIHTVRCPLAAWEQHGPSLVARHPIQRVEATDAAGESHARANQNCPWSVRPVLIYGAPGTPAATWLTTWLRSRWGSDPEKWWHETEEDALRALSTEVLAWAVAEAKARGLWPCTPVAP